MCVFHIFFYFVNLFPSFFANKNVWEASRPSSSVESEGNPLNLGAFGSAMGEEIKFPQKMLPLKTQTKPITFGRTLYANRSKRKLISNNEKKILPGQNTHKKLLFQPTKKRCGFQKN